MRLRGMLRWALRAVGVMVALLLLGVAVVIGLLSTRWGRGVVERRLEAGLNGWLDGHVEIGRLDGDLFGHPILRDVVVTDRAGRELLRVSRIEVDVDLAALFDQTIRLRTLEIERPIVTAHQDSTGAIDLASLVPPSDAAPSAWAVVIEGVTLDQGLIAFWPYAGDVLVFDGVRVRGTVSADQAAVRIAGLAVDLGAAHVAVRTGELARDGSRARVALRIEAPADEIAMLLDEPRWTGDVGAVVDLARDGVDAPWRVAVSGEVAGAPLSAEATIASLPGPSLAGSLTVKGLEPSAAWTEAPAGWASVAARFEAEGRVLPELVARARVEARGAAGPYRLDDLVVDAEVDRGELAFDVFVAGASPFGHGTVKASAGGLADQLTANATARLRDLRVGTTRVATLDVDAHAIGLPDAPVGTVRATARRIASGPSTRISGATVTATVHDAGRRIAASLRVGGPAEPFSGAADVRVVREARRTTVAFDRVEARTRGIVWQGNQGRVTVTTGGGIALDDLALRSSAGSLTASGELGAVGDRLAVELRGLDLGALRGAFAPTAPDVRGAIDARLVIQRRANRVHAAELAVRARALKIVRAVDPFGLDVTARLEARTLTGAIQIDGGRIGTLGLSIETTTPLDPLDVAAWAQLDERDVRSVRLALGSIDLAGVADLLNVGARVPGLRGTVGGEVVATTGGEDRVTADLTLVDVMTAQLRQPVTAHLKGRLGEETTSASIRSTLAGRPLARGELTIDAGSTALRRGASRSFLTVPVRGHLEVDGLPLEAVARAVDVAIPVVGRLSLRADVTRTLTEPTVDLRASLSRGTRVRDVVMDKFELTGRLDPAKVVARLSAAQRRGGTLDGALSVDRDDARRGRLELTAARFDLSFLAVEAATNPLGFREGTLDAKLSIAGTRTEHTADGWLEVRGARLRATEMVETLHDARLRLEIAGGRTIKGTLVSRVGRGGRLEADGTATIQGLALGTLEGNVRARDLAVAAPGAKAKVDFTAVVRGKPADDLYALDVTVERATIKLPDELKGQVLHPTAPLEDVVYVDADGKVVTPAVTRAPPALRLTLHTSSPLILRGTLTRAEISTQVTALIGAAEPEVSGDVRVQRGFVELFGRRWTIQTARVVLDGTVPPDPQLDIRLIHEFATTTVAISIRGTAKEPQLTLSSDDGRYDQSQLLAFVLGGSPDDDGPGGGEVDASVQAVNAASGMLLGKLQPVLKQVVPVDVVSVKQGSAGQGETLLTLGKWFTRDVFVAYHHRFPDQLDEIQNANEGSLDWYFTRRWRTELLFGDRGEGSADVLWIHRW